MGKRASASEANAGRRVSRDEPNIMGVDVECDLNFGSDGEEVGAVVGVSTKLLPLPMLLPLPLMADIPITHSPQRFVLYFASLHCIDLRYELRAAGISKYIACSLFKHAE